MKKALFISGLLTVGLFCMAASMDAFNGSTLKTVRGGAMYMVPMTPQLPTAISIGAATSVQWSGLPGGSQIRVTCTTATAVQFRCGVPALTALVTDNEFLPPAVLDLTLMDNETACAFFSTGGNNCKAAVRNSP